MHPMDLRDGVHFDLTDKRVLGFVVDLILRGVVWVVHLAPVCAPWSKAKGFRLPFDAKHPDFATASTTLVILRACRLSAVRFSLENPLTSGLWAWKPLLAELARHQETRLPVHWTRVDYCALGMPYQKPTYFCVNDSVFAIP